MPVQNPVLNSTGDVSLCSLEKAICNPFMGFLTVLKINAIPSLEAHWCKVFLLLSQTLLMNNRKRNSPAPKREGDNLFITCTFVRVLTFSTGTYGALEVSNADRKRAVSTASGNPDHDDREPLVGGEGGPLVDAYRRVPIARGDRDARSYQMSTPSVFLHERRGFEVIIIHLSLENG